MAKPHSPWERAGNDDLIDTDEAANMEEQQETLNKQNDDEAPSFQLETTVSILDDRQAKNTQSIPHPGTKLTIEAKRIDKLENDLRKIKESLNSCMEKAKSQLSQRQVETYKWVKLAAAQGIYLDFPMAARTGYVAQPISVIPTEADGIFRHYDSNSNVGDDEMVKERPESEEIFPRLVITSSGFLQVKAMSDSPENGTSIEKAGEAPCPAETKNAGSRSTSLKIDRIRQQEGKIRKILLGMKESIQPKAEAGPNSAEREPSVNECLGLTEFYPH